MYYLEHGVGGLERLRKPLMVSRVTANRAKANLAYQSMGERIDPAKKPVWFRSHAGLDIPYWMNPEYVEREKRNPKVVKSDLLYTPYWMKNRSRARLIQRPRLSLKPKSQVLYHLGTDEEDGLGKGFKPFKAISRMTKITKTSFQGKKIFGAIGSVAANVVTGGLASVVAPKIFSASSKQMKMLGMAVSAIAVVAGGIILGPAIAAALGPMLSSAGAMLGKAVTGMTVFKGAFNALSSQKRESMAAQLSASQIADIETGRAQLTEGGLVYGGNSPGVYGDPSRLGGNASEVVPLPDSLIAPLQAGMFGGMSPLMLGVMIGGPLAFQFLFKDKK